MLVLIGVTAYLYFSGNLTPIINSITKKEDKTQETKTDGDNHNHEHVTGEDGIEENIIFDDFQ